MQETMRALREKSVSIINGQGHQAVYVGWHVDNKQAVVRRESIRLL